MPIAPMIDEDRFEPRTLDQAKDLYQDLVAAGTSRAVARGLVGWLITRPERRSEDPTTGSLRRDYRRELLRLGAPPWERSDAKGAYRGSRVISRRLDAQPPSLFALFDRLAS